MKIPKGSDVKWLTREAKRVAKAMLASGDNDPAEALEWTYRDGTEAEAQWVIAKATVLWKKLKKAVETAC